MNPSLSKSYLSLLLQTCTYLFLFVTGDSVGALGPDFQAKVIYVTDGDTITVLNDAKEEIEIRLNGVDCPEQGQAFGNKAKNFTRDLVIDELVTIKAYD